LSRHMSVELKVEIRQTVPLIGCVSAADLPAQEFEGWSGLASTLASYLDSQPASIFDRLPGVDTGLDLGAG
jgi:hypothetical protein